jgi:hypothetical protein
VRWAASLNLYARLTHPLPIARVPSIHCLFVESSSVMLSTGSYVVKYQRDLAVAAEYVMGLTQGARL